jgi:Transposase DDE domain
MSTTTRRRTALSRWAALLRQRFPTMSSSQALGLALWSIGIVLARSASLHAVVLALVCWLPWNPLSLRKRLQEWYLEAAAKKGSGTGHTGVHRRDWNPRTTSAYLLRWILEDWPNRQLVLALDPTNFEDRFTVLAISVLYRGCAVPVTWTVLPGNEPGAWEPHWERMLKGLATLVPPGYQVLVLTDRGMYSPQLFRCLVSQGWHPFLRIRAQGFWRPRGSRKWRDLSRLPLPPDQTRAWTGEVFKNDEGRLNCTLVGYAGGDHAEPWLIVTDLAPEVAQASWYGLRGWIEQGFKRVKGEGWRLPRTRIRSCARLERLWLAVAVATLWVLEVGGEAEVAEPGRGGAPKPKKEVGKDMPALPDLKRGEPEEAPGTGPRPGTSAERTWGVFGRGWNLVRNALAVGVVLLGSWHPEAWPDHPWAGLPPTPAADTAEAGASREGSDQRPVTTMKNAAHRLDSS